VPTDNPLVFVRVYPPRPLEAKAVEALLLRLASDPTSAPVVFEVSSVVVNETPEVSYWLGCRPEHARWLWRTMFHHLPGLLLDTTPALPRKPVTCAARVKITPPALALATDRPEQIAVSVLSSLNPYLHTDEQLTVQVQLGPRRAGRHHGGPLADPTQAWWAWLSNSQRPASAVVRKQYDQRWLQAGAETEIRIGVIAEDPARGERLLTGVLAGLSTAKAAGTFMELNEVDADQLNDARPPKRWQISPAAAELVGLLAWPVGEQDLPGLPALHPRTLPVPPAVPQTDRVFGVSALPGSARVVGLAAADSLMGVEFIGPTGVGKSSSMLHLIKADIHAGRAALVIEPKGQLIDDILDRAVPLERIDDVVLIDPADEHCPGFNPLDVGRRDPDVVVDGLLAVFAAVFHEGWGPRTQDIFHGALLTLARAGVTRQASQCGEPFTLVDLPSLLTDPGFRRSVIGHVTADPVLAQFWASFEAQSPQALATALAAPMNKLRQYLMRPSMRRVLGQTQPTFRLRDVFAERKIVLVPLNEARIGPITAQLLGGLIVAETWSATLERAAEVSPMSRPAGVYIDEAHNYLHLPTALDAALAASRSMGVSWHMSHQFRAQLPSDMLAAVDTNARNKIVFRLTDPKDAAAYARQAPGLAEVDFLTLPKYQAYATLVADGEQQPWCSVATLPPPEPTGLGQQIRVVSRATYGATSRPAFDPADGAATHPASQESGTPDVPVGRKRRTATPESGA
jgi:hypothetical protein